MDSPTIDSPAPRKKRRAVFRVAVVAALVALGALAYYPERPITPFRAMPDECVIATENLRLAEKWRERISNPAVLAVMRICGVDEPEEIASDAQLELILNLLCGRRTVLGMAPELGDAGLPAFVGASYVGARLLPLRFIVLIRHVPGIGPLHRTEEGTMYLDFEEEKESDHEVLSLDLREGVLLAAWSLDKNAVRALSARVAGKAEPAPVFDGATPWESPLREPMRAWFDRGFLLPADEMWLGANPSVAVRKWDSAAIDATIRATIREPSGGEVAFPALAKSCAALDTLPDEPPIALAVVPGAALAGLAADAPGDACAILARQDMGGKIMGIAIPALQVTFPSASSAAGTGRLLREMLGDIFGAGAVDRGAKGSRFLLDIPGLSIIRTPDADCMALDSYPGWATFTTSATVADNLRAAPVDGTAQWRKGWRDTYAKEKPAAYFWADTASIAEEARRLLSVYRLAATFIPELGDPETTATAARIAMALDELAAAEQVECAAEYAAGQSDGASKTLELSLGIGPAGR